MINFFRKIRQRLLTENTLGKYALYAVGEILLVVIGILIALQIDNYSERQKRIQKEVEVLHLFREALQTDLKKFQYVEARYARSRASIVRILDHLENDRPYHDCLDADFFYSTTVYEQTSFTNGPFETLKSAGIELVTNTALQKKILEVYDDWDPWLETTENIYVALVLGAGKDLYKTRFDQFWHGTEKDSVLTGIMHPLDYDGLKNDPEYSYFLKTQMNMMYWRVEYPMREATLHGTILKNMIEKELEILAEQ